MLKYHENYARLKFWFQNSCILRSLRNQRSWSSLGGIGGNFFTPIINPPEVAILGVGKTFEKVKKVNGQFITRKILPVSLSYDHRVIDGAEGARFCVHLSQSLGKDFAFKLAV